MTHGLYYAPDGTIHRRPVSVANTNNHRHDNGHTPSCDLTGGNYIKPRNILKAICYWLISTVLSVLIGIWLKEVVASCVSGGDSNLFKTIAPYACAIGSIAGSFLYGIFFSWKGTFNLGCYFLSALSAIGGGIGGLIIVGIIYLILIICLYMIAIAFIICILLGLMDG